MKCFLPLTLFITLLTQFCFADKQVVTYVKPESGADPRHQYYVELLALALNKGEDQNSNTVLQQSLRDMQQSRAVQQLAKNKYIDILWTVTSKHREKLLRPIRIPLIKGLLGQRVFIIRKEDKHKFESVHTIEDLRVYIAGQGHDWPDTKILQANDIKVATTSTYDGLFSMLSAQRFDYFPRGVNEAWDELAVRKNPGLIVEETLLLRYPSPVYFFVTKNNISLAEKIEKGLLCAIEDGSFDRLFDAYHKKIISQANLKNRTTILLHNPLIPDPISNK